MASNLLSEALSKSSRDSYKHVYQVYRQFIIEQFPSSPIIPATLENLTMFIANCFQKNLAASTVLTYISALSYLHKLGGYVDLTQHFIFRKTLQGYSNLRCTKDSRLPITPSILKGLISSLPHTSTSRFLGCMLRAMYLLAFHAFLRIGEITGPQPPLGNCLGMNSIHFLFEKSTLPYAVEIQMSHFKHSKGKHIPTLLIQQNLLQENMCPVKSLWEYIQLRGVDKVHSSKPQPLFSFMDNSPISRHFFTQQLQLSLKYIGLHHIHM